MTAILDKVRADPTGALLLLCALVVASAAALLWLEDVPVTRLWPHAAPLRVIEAPPPEWRARARREDVISVPGYDVAYWGRPDRAYFRNRRLDPPRAIVWHYPVASDPIGLIRNVIHCDPSLPKTPTNCRRRHKGYHFVIDQQGRIFQAVPLTRQTLHVKQPHEPERTKAFPWLDNSNSISATIMDACVRVCRVATRPCPLVHVRCSAERVSKAAQAAGLALSRALMARFGIPCRHVTGHGQLQTDRAEVEGSTMTRIIRESCGLE